MILVPGFWLGAESWSDVSEHLTTARVTHTALTLPGLEIGARAPETIRLADHVAAVHDAIDRSGPEVVLVGHSGAGPICHTAAATRRHSIRRVIHVDTWPLPPGFSINLDLAGGAGVIPLPDWGAFEAEDLTDMTDPMRERLVREARSQPAAIAREEFPSAPEGRFDIPTSIICCEFSADQLRGWSSTGEPRLGELTRMRDVSYIDLPTGHWPQFTKPAELAAALVSVA
jgi:pimeloyl-ACP methyl ester carboxylesterase